MDVWFFFVVMFGQVIATGPFTEEECVQRLHEERGPEDIKRPVQSVCIEKGRRIITPKWNGCHEDDGACYSHEGRFDA